MYISSRSTASVRNIYEYGESQDAQEFLSNRLFPNEDFKYWRFSVSIQFF
jgi:hypothetical protein